MAIEKQATGITRAQRSASHARTSKREYDATATSSASTRSHPKKVKKEIDDPLDHIPPELAEKLIESSTNGTAPADLPTPDPAALLRSRKLKAYSATSGQSPFPEFARPSAEEAKRAHQILARLHGTRTRPKTVIASRERAGCGDSPSVLDALVRTILSQNTSGGNSTRAKRSMDAVYGASDGWDAIVAGGPHKLEETIKSGGLARTKSRVIIGVLESTKQKYGEYSLDHLFSVGNEEAMHELLGFQGVGPKTASCVLLFCLQRESFAVDTHVHRITGVLGWRPASASRDETHAHLDARIPDEDKYGLHILLVIHGKECEECKAGGKSGGKCELRKAFQRGRETSTIASD